MIDGWRLTGLAAGTLTGMASMQGQCFLVTGITNERSLATAVARQLADNGAGLVLSYQNERLRERAAGIAAALPTETELVALDVADATAVDAFCAARPKGSLQGFLHGIAFGRLRDAQGDALPLTAVDDERFNEAMRISAHSLARLAGGLRAALVPGAGVVALTYLGARRVRRGYDLMGVAKAALEAEVRYLAAELGSEGIRVNAVSAGPVRTAASAGVPGFAERLSEHAARAALGRNVDAAEVAQAAVFLLSSAASGISGQILHVDAGYAIM